MGCNRRKYRAYGLADGRRECKAKLAAKDKIISSKDRATKLAIADSYKVGKSDGLKQARANNPVDSAGLVSKGFKDGYNKGLERGKALACLKNPKIVYKDRVVYRDRPVYNHNPPVSNYQTFKQTRGNDGQYPSFQNNGSQLQATSSENAEGMGSFNEIKWSGW
jgi:hypothetical protein